MTVMINLGKVFTDLLYQAYLRVMTVYPLVFIGGESFDTVNERLNKNGYVCFRKIKVKKDIADYYYSLWDKKEYTVVRVYLPENRCVLTYTC